MTIPYTALCLDTIYSVLSTDAVLENGDVIPVIDKTSGISIQEGIGLETIKPAVSLRKYTLSDKNIEIEDLLQSEIEVNGKTFNIVNHRPFPGINGEDDGEIYLILHEAE